MQSVTLPRKRLADVATGAKFANRCRDLKLLLLCAGWMTWLWTAMKRWTTVRWTR